MQPEIIQTDQVTCSPEWSWESDHNGWNGYHLWSVLAGEGRVEMQGAVYRLVPGDCFFFDLSRNHSCSHTPENPLKLETVHFDCREKITVKNPHISGNSLLSGAIHGCVVRDRLYQRREAGQWLACAVSEFASPAEETDSPEKRKVDSWCQWMDANVGKPFSLELLCRRAGYSPNQVIRIFKRQRGETPYRYFMNCRIRKSITLLLYTGDSMEKIAAATGFYDEAHFSRYFKKNTGYPPQTLRRHREKS